MGLSLNIGKDNSGNIWLCMSEPEMDHVEPLAVFRSEKHSELFVQYMEERGYTSIRRPTEEDYNKLLRGDS